MAGGLEIKSQQISEDYGGKITWFVIVSCMMAAVGAALFGYDIGITGGVTSMEPFLNKFFPKVYAGMKQDTKISNYCKFDSQVLTAFTSSFYVSGLFATFVASFVTQSFGRKASILVGSTAFLAGSALGAAAYNVYMIIFGRFLLGIGVGFTNQSVPLYLSEMAPAKYRGAFNNGFQLSIGIGGLTANLINFGTEKIKGGWGWRVSLAMAAVPATILAISALFLPETPNSTIQRTSDHQRANMLLQRIRGTTNVQAELDDIIEASLISKAADNSLGKLLSQRRYRPQLVMAVLIPFFQQATGINVIAFYAPILFRTIGFGESAALLLSIVASGIVGVTATFVSMLVVDRFGRRALFLFGGIQMFIPQVVIGAVMAAEFKDHGTIGEGCAYLIIVLISIYVAGFGWSWGPLAWLVPSEIFPLEIRSAAQSITVGVSFVFTFIIAQLFLAMLCHFKAGIFFFFGGWMFIMTSFVYFLLPETKSIPIEKMESIWKQHWFWGRVVCQDE